MGLDLSSGAQITIGVCVGVVSTSIQSLGLTLQRKSHLLEDDRPHVNKRPPHRRRRWQIGIFLFIVSNILGSSIQITTLPLVILSPLQASGLVFNSICATLILSEPFTRHSLVGTLLVCVGATLIAAFGAMKEPAHSLDELLDLLARRPFLLWMGGTTFVVIGILVAVKANSILRPRLRHTGRMRMIRGIAYGCVSGILSAHCLLLAKSAVELLVRTVVDRVNQFNRWQSWMILLGLITLALTQLYYLHRGLKLCSTSVLYPLVFCVYNIIAILDGLLYYRQTSRLSVLHGCFIALGTAILLTGVFALSWRLDADGTPQPSTSTSALSPGINFVDTSDSEASEPYHDTPYHDTPSSPTSQPARFFKRRRTLSQAEEIWGELQDDGHLRHHRDSLGTDDEDEDDETDANETTGLLKRSSSAPGLGLGTTRRTPSRSRGGGGGYLFPRVGNARARHRRGQEAVGGWWRMKWWKPKTEGEGGRGGGGGGGGEYTGRLLDEEGAL